MCHLVQYACLVHVISWNISKMGWVAGRAAVQAWEDINVKISCLFFFPPDAHSLTSNSLFVQLLFCFLAEDNSGQGGIGYSVGTRA